MPVFNGARTLRRQLESILNQSFTGFQLFITDNASEDETAAICRDYQADGRLHYHRNHQNLGVGFSYLKGCYAAAGFDYMIYASSNDQWEPGYLEQCARALEESPDAVLAYSYCRLVDQEGAPVRRQAMADNIYRDSFNLVGLSPQERFLEILSKMDLCTSFYGLVRVANLFANERFLLASAAGGDNLFLNALALDGPFIQVPEPLFIREMPAHADQSLVARRRHFEKINQVRSDHPTFPFFNHLIATLNIVNGTSLDPESKNDLYGRVVGILQARSGHHQDEEIRRAVEAVMQGRLHAGFSGQEAFASSRYKYLDYFTIADLLTNLERAWGFLDKTLPGLHLARGICYLSLGRRREAALALERELAERVFPYDAYARQLLAKGSLAADGRGGD